MKAMVRSKLNGNCKYCRRKGCSAWHRFIHRFVLCERWTWTDPDKELDRKKWRKSRVTKY